MTTPTSPGWYDDPETPDQLRYFDGIVWTRHTTPRAGLAATPVVEVAAPQAPAPAQPGSPVPPGAGQWPGQGGQAGQGGQGQWPGQQWPGQGSRGHDQWPVQGGQGQNWAAGHRPVGPTTRDGVPLASYGQRIGAFLIDGLIKLVLNLVFGGYPFYRAFQTYWSEFADATKAGRSTPLLMDMSQVDLGWLTAFGLISAGVGLVYSVFFNVRRGATPGKSAVGISVRSVDHPGPLDVTTAVRRAAIPFVVALTSFVPLVSTLTACLWVADHALPLTQKRRQALHDLLAGTQVVQGPQPPKR